MNNSTRQEREAKHFDRLASSTGEVWWGSVTPAGIARLECRARAVADQLKYFSDPYVLELGCGTGALTKPLVAVLPNIRLVGIDISPKTIEVIRKEFSVNPRVRFEVGDAAQAPFSDASFDGVIGNSLLHHVSIKETLHEVFRLLRSGGIIWFSEPNMMNPQVALERNVRFIGKRLQNSEDETAFFRWSFARLLRKAGFIEVSVRPFDFMHPALPTSLISTADIVGRFIERVPLVREIAGSLVISAKKP